MLSCRLQHKLSAFPCLPTARHNSHNNVLAPAISSPRRLSSLGPPSFLVLSNSGRLNHRYPLVPSNSSRLNHYSPLVPSISPQLPNSRREQLTTRSFTSSSTRVAREKNHEERKSAKSNNPKRESARSSDQKGDSPSYVPAYVDKLARLQDGIANGHVKSIITDYLDLRAIVKLGGADVEAMAKALHLALRDHNREKESKKKAHVDFPLPAELTALADLLVADISAHALPPNHAAHILLLDFYRSTRQFEKGLDFWASLRSQDESFVSPAVYGSAIYLLAVQGSPPEDTESLFIEALKRFPGSFNEYHLSPNARLPDRTRPFTLSGISTKLFKAIMNARLLQGDIRSAYTALDSALRINTPSLSFSFATTFIQVRPVSEAYKVFMMACRSGSSPFAISLGTTLEKLLKIAELVDPLERGFLLRAMITATYAYADTGGSLNSRHLRIITSAITSLFKHHHVQALSKDELNHLVDDVMLSINKLFTAFANQGCRPGVSTFNVVITNVAQNTGREDVITDCLARMQHLGIEPTVVTRRVVLSAVGSLKDPEYLRAAWLSLLQEPQTGDPALYLGNWVTLIKAAKAMGEEDFVRREIQEFSELKRDGFFEDIQRRLDQDTPKVPAAVTADKDFAERAKRLVNQLHNDVKCLDDRLSDDPLRNSHRHPLSMSLTGRGPELDEQHSRELYDELTADESIKQAEQSHEGTSDMQATRDFTYAELRYQNWKTINELLIESEKSDADYIAAVKAAIAQDKKQPNRDDIWIKSVDAARPFIGLSDVDSERDGSAVESDQPVDLRDEVRRLRGI